MFLQGKRGDEGGGFVLLGNIQACMLKGLVPRTQGKKMKEADCVGQKIRQVP
jgi:hypothetical protein